MSGFLSAKKEAPSEHGAMVKGRKEIIIDGKNHLLGRLAAVVAKTVLEGGKVTVIRCEDIIQSGKQFRNRLKYMSFLRKHSNSNPTKHSHIHYRSPSMIFKRTCRGMLPHKTAHGADALDRIRVFEGCPTKLALKRKVRVPECLKHLRIQNCMPVTRLGDLAASVGWKHDATIQRLEAERKAKGSAHYAKAVVASQEAKASRDAAIANAPAEIREALALLD